MSFSHQDWTSVNVGKSAKPYSKPQTEGEKKAEIQKLKKQGLVSTEAKMGATTNKSTGGHGPMGTTAGAAARKIDEETETFKPQRTGLEFGKALMQARTAKKMTQKDLATKVNEKPSVVQEYETGKAVPNPQVISKLERALGAKLPRPPKQPKKKSDEKS
ncbi:hypothetical protein CTAYLR_009779 [Chrysophaeum taylorii]|uniref:HTH cro/C1-type domain-containing protein n=1 Tax=Chrysophaeum taylorii TaxID=2483200 RepID=A0AAD7UH39_9STRA|nr:hypothetical protein CTAYLR_009779 [Chrysophaeum taylorii]